MEIQTDSVRSRNQSKRCRRTFVISKTNLVLVVRGIQNIRIQKGTFETTCYRFGIQTSFKLDLTIRYQNGFAYYRIVLSNETWGFEL